MTDIDTFELPGRVLLSDGTEHDCSVRCKPDDATELVLAASVPPGARLVCHVPSLGMLECLAGDATGSGCRLTVLATSSYRARLAARMAWHRRRAAGHDDQRSAERVVSSSSVVRLGWPDGRAAECALIDLSATGAALQSPERPEPGSTVVVGKRRAVVVRHLAEGFAVRFVLSLRPEDVTVGSVL